MCAVGARLLDCAHLQRWENFRYIFLKNKKRKKKTERTVYSIFRVDSESAEIFARALLIQKIFTVFRTYTRTTFYLFLCNG